METVKATYFSSITHLQCPQCAASFDAAQVQTYATCCNQPLLAQYGPSRLNKYDVQQRAHNMWRYHELLPVLHKKHIVSLGEGWTPIHSLTRLAGQLNHTQILMKDESVNPTGSFKARGISAAISKAKELGIRHVVMPTAGNAGGALSAYAAKAGIKATVIMPRHSADTLKEECRLYGAELLLIQGLIDVCGKKAKQLAADSGAFDMSTLKEPYRLEGKKTLGYEIAEQLEWKLPDVIVYPTGGGTGLIGMWKAFKEMLDMQWIKGKLPRMIIIQTKNCDPMVQLLEKGVIPSTFSPLPSAAFGLAVPYPFAKTLLQEIVKESNGTALSVTEEEIDAGIHEVAAAEGFLLSPEGSAAYVGLKKLIEKDYVKEDETVLFFNTGSWYKYR